MKQFTFGSYGSLFAGSMRGSLQFGGTTPRPPVQEFINKGWIQGKLCEAKPKGVTQSGAYTWVGPDAPNWMQGPYYDEGSAAYVHYKLQDGSDQFWLYTITTIPCGGSAASDPTLTITTDYKKKVMAVQTALNQQMTTAPALVVDGVPGPLTCAAAHAHQVTTGDAYELELGVYGNLLGEVFFNSLGLPGPEYVVMLGAMCSDHDPVSGEVLPVVPEPEIPEPGPSPIPPPKPKPVLPPPPGPVEPTKAGFPWWMGMLMVGTLVGTAVVARKKKPSKKKRKKSKKRGRRR